MTSSLEPLAAYEVVPLPTLTIEELDAIVDRHAIDVDGPIEPLRSSGVVHSLWSLGSRWVLRVPKNEPMCLGDHRCEAVAIPLVLGVGVRTPALQVFDESLTILDVPFSIVERVHGTDLSASARRCEPHRPAHLRRRSPTRLGVVVARVVVNADSQGQVRDVVLLISCCSTCAETIAACWPSLGPPPRKRSTDSASSHFSKTLILSFSSGSADRWKSRHPGACRAASMTWRHSSR